MQDAPHATPRAAVRLMAEMSRRPLVIALVALLAALLLAPIVLLMLAGFAGDGAAPAQPGATGEEAVDHAGERLQPDQVVWTYVSQSIEGAAPRSYGIQAGRLGEDGPILDFEAEWDADPLAEAGRQPAVAQAADGAVFYATDDGARSVLWRVALVPNAVAEVVAQMPEVVWSLAVAPDGTSAYAALFDRVDNDRDRGVVRLALDGSGEVTRIMQPAAAAPPAVRLAAWVGFDVDLRLADDGRHLARRACVGGGGCETQVLDVTSGEVVSIGEREVHGLVNGVVLALGCDQPAGCRFETVDLATGAVAELPQAAHDARLSAVGGRAVVAFLEAERAGGAILRAADPHSGDVFDLLRPIQPSGMKFPAATSGALSLGAPAGCLLVSVDAGEDGAVVRFRTFAVPLDGGVPVALPDVPLRIVEPMGVQG